MSGRIPRTGVVPYLQFRGFDEEVPERIVRSSTDAPPGMCRIPASPGRLAGIKGNIYLLNDNGEELKILIENSGSKDVSLVQEYSPTKPTPAANPNVAYGHGMLCAPGAVRYQQLRFGTLWGRHRIVEGGYLIVGLRGLCWAVAQIPAAGTKPVVLNLESRDFRYYEHPTTSKRS